MRRFDTPPYYITAYGLAVKHGFKGTEEEWLASLHANEIEIRYLNGMLQWHRVPNESEESDTPTDEGETEDEAEDLYAWHDLIDIAGIRSEVIEQAMEETVAAAEIAKSEAAKVEGTRAFAEAANQTAESAIIRASAAKSIAESADAKANDAKQGADIALGIAEAIQGKQATFEQFISEVDRDLQDKIQDVSEDAAEALQIANDVKQEMEDYSPSGTRSIAEAAMRMASERLVAPETAAVGQYFRVKEVDENGAVTAVEAVDAPSGSGGANEVFVKTEDGETLPAEIEFDLGNENTPALVVAPDTAKVGQTIIVKVVDNNGKPTAWECIDIPTGGATVDEGVVLLAESPALTEEATSIEITGLNLTEKGYLFRLTGSQNAYGNGLDIEINGSIVWNYTPSGSDVFIGFGLINDKWVLKIYESNLLSRSLRNVISGFSGTLNSVKIMPHYSETNFVVGTKLMIYKGLLDAIALAE